MLSAVGFLLGFTIAGADLSDELQIDSALLTLTEHADVSASETGLLSMLTVNVGETIEAGRPLAKIDDRDAKLVRERAETEMKLAKSIAENDIKIRFAKLSLGVANAELSRALESNLKFAKSVSQTEVDRLKLLADKAELEVEQAEIDRQQARLSLQIKQQELDRATLALERRTIVAPFPGMVVQWKKQHGEWVETGSPVIRLIRLNRLRAEAFIASSKVPPSAVGRSVELTISHAGKQFSKHVGKLVFVSPEIDPVNGQVLVWAEIENDALTLRPGQTGSLKIGSIPITPQGTKP